MLPAFYFPSSVKPPEYGKPLEVRSVFLRLPLILIALMFHCARGQCCGERVVEIALVKMDMPQHSAPWSVL